MRWRSGHEIEALQSLAAPSQFEGTVEELVVLLLLQCPLPVLAMLRIKVVSI
jgi:hypothetical protein